MCSACLSSLIPALALCALANAATLRVCADPNNLPFSNQRGEGIENRLAELVARDLGLRLEYVWWPERGSLIRNTLAANRCDALMGLPAGMPGVATTDPYYRSTYVFVERRGSAPPVTSFTDERLAKMRIGIHVVGEDYAPPAVALGRRGLAANLKGYSLFGADDEKDPSAKLIEAVARSEVDIAVAWGPTAAYFARRYPDLEMTPVSPSSYPGVPFTYSISAAVRVGDIRLRDLLNAVLQKECGTIRALVAEYGFPAPDSGKDAGKQEAACASAR